MELDVERPVRGGQRPLDEGTLSKMTSSIVHRGPDEGGGWIGPGAALGIRRLSIIDVEGSHQPVVSEDGVHPMSSGS